MKIRKVSDLHSEHWVSNPILIFDELVPRLEDDKNTILCIAGDLGSLHSEAYKTILRHASGRFKAVICVLGNHEFYFNNYFSNAKAVITKLNLPDNIFILENDTVEIVDVVFVGCTLWTNMMFRNHDVMHQVKSKINDFALIQTDRGVLHPMNTVLKFEESEKYIFREIKKAREAGKKVVVLTHHLPSFKSIHPKYAGNIINAAFASEINIGENGPDIWFHGHTHQGCGYMENKTRVICNPFGYWEKEENMTYNGKLMIEI